jgi:RHS repeat-associated protein
MNECNKYADCAPFLFRGRVGDGVFSFDAYGRRRDKDDWSYTLTGEPALFADRGYTGHEHLTEFGLINMNLAIKRAHSKDISSTMPNVSQMGKANGRLYDPLVGRFLSPDNYVQAPDYTQSFNRYGYCWNNPLRYTDPEGDFVLEACLIAAGVGILIDYGMQVGMNYLEARNNPAMTAKDIWLNKIDWFDIAVSGTISGLTAGYGAAITAGETVGKFGLFMVKYSNFVSLGSSVLTSAVDITGEGWQKVEMYDFGKRVLVAGVTWGATEIVGNLVKSKKVSQGFNSGNNLIEGYNVQFGSDANQIHHTFRHTDALGLNRTDVKTSILEHFKNVSSQVVEGNPLNQIIEIGGQKIQYTAYLLPSGMINIGRIHGIN